MEYDWRRNMWMIVIGVIVISICLMGCTQQRKPWTIKNLSEAIEQSSKGY